MKIQDLAITTETKDGVVLVFLGKDDMPPNSIAVFIKKEDYPELLRLIGETEDAKNIPFNSPRD